MFAVNGFSETNLVLYFCGGVGSGCGDSDGGGGGGGYPRLLIYLYCDGDGGGGVDIPDDSLTAGMSVLVIFWRQRWIRMMVLWIRLTGSVFVSKMSKHGVSPWEGLVTTDAKHDDQSSKVKSSSYTVSVSCKLSSS